MQPHLPSSLAHGNINSLTDNRPPSAALTAVSTSPSPTIRGPRGVTSVTRGGPHNRKIARALGSDPGLTAATEWIWGGESISVSLPMTPAPPPPTGSERGPSASGCCRHCSPEQPRHAEASPRHIQTLLGAQAQEARTNTLDIRRLDRRVTTTATSEGLLALPSSLLLIRFPT